MITQTIKRWFSKACSWWPWKRQPEQSPAAPLGVARGGGLHELSPPPLFEGNAFTQPGTAPRRPSLEELPNQRPALPPPAPEGLAGPSSAPLQTSRGAGRGPERLPSQDAVPALPPTPATGPLETPAAGSVNPEHRLEFLRYLVQRGMVNEGFAQGETPQQYKKW
jgi:hypothetical protein